MSGSGSFLRYTSRLLTALAAIVACSFVLGEWCVVRSEAAQIEIWSLYLNREIKALTAETRHDQILVIQDHTGPAYRRWLLALLWPAAVVSKSGPPLSRFPELQASTYASFLLGKLRSHPISDTLDVSAPVRLATPAVLATYGQPAWDVQFPGSTGYFVLSTVAFNLDQTQAVMEVDHVHGLSGHGDYILLQKVNGIWTIQDEASTWVS